MPAGIQLGAEIPPRMRGRMRISSEDRKRPLLIARNAAVLLAHADLPAPERAVRPERRKGTELGLLRRNIMGIVAQGIE